MPAQAPTSVLSIQATAGVASGWTLAKGLSVQTGVGVGSTWQALKLGWIQKGVGVNNTWEIRYSTPTVAANNCSGSTGGSSATGTVTSGTPAASSGGNDSGSLSHHWFYSSGDGSIAPSDATIQNPTFSATVANGSPKSAVWGYYSTDNNTGATSNTVFITVSLNWTNTFVGFTDTYTSGSGTENVPAGATALLMIIAGPGGGGSGGQSSGGNGHFAGGGGGAVVSFSSAISPSDYGAAINWTVGSVGAGGAVNVSGSAGVAASTSGWVSVTAGAGGGGLNSINTGSGGAGGVASGPGSLFNGAPGFDAVFGGIGGNGANNYPGTPLVTAGSGGTSNLRSAGSNGTLGSATFQWT